MDLVAGVKKVVILMEHVAKDGSAKLVANCTLPLTGAKVVDIIVSELGAFEIVDEGVKIAELAPNVSFDEVRDQSEANIFS